MMTSDQVQVLQELLSLAERTIRMTSPTQTMAEQRLERLHRELTLQFPEDAVSILEKRHYKQRTRP